MWAVGYDQSGDGKIEHWDGSTWISSSFPRCRFKSVSAISADDVWIVGVYAVLVNYVWDYHMLRAHWDGSIWTVTITADHDWLNGVDMISSGEGWDVGYLTLEHYTGSWVSLILNPYVPIRILNSIEMLSATDIPLIARCELIYIDTRLQPVNTLVLACPRMDMFRLWPLPMQHPWFEDPWYDKPDALNG